MIYGTPWTIADSSAYPPTHCGKCGSKLIASIETASYDRYGGTPQRHIWLRCPLGETHEAWLAPITHSRLARYDLS